MITSLNKFLIVQKLIKNICFIIQIENKDKNTRKLKYKIYQKIFKIKMTPFLVKILININKINNKTLKNQIFVKLKIIKNVVFLCNYRKFKTILKVIIIKNFKIYKMIL